MRRPHADGRLFRHRLFAQTPEGEDATNDSGVVYEEPEKEEPLTPDGNATLVDDFGGNKQLITVTTKTAITFISSLTGTTRARTPYISLIKWTKPTLWHSWRTEAPKQPLPAVCSCTEKCEAGKVNVSCPVCKDNMTACSGKEAEPETEEPPEQPKEKGNAGGLVLFLVVALLGGGGAFYYFKFMKQSRTSRAAPTLKISILTTTTRTSRSRTRGTGFLMKNRRTRKHDPVYRQSL